MDTPHKHHSSAQLELLLSLSDELLGALGEGDWSAALELERRREFLLYNPAGADGSDARQRELLTALKTRNDALTSLAGSRLAQATASLRDLKAGARASEAYAAV